MRHSWVHPKEHCYVCRTCGTCRINSLDARGWIATWHAADGRVFVSDTAPACEVGRLTAKRLAHYAAEIAADDAARKAKRAARKAAA